jgi:hypothetical protein
MRFRLQGPGTVPACIAAMPDKSVMKKITARVDFPGELGGFVEGSPLYPRRYAPATGPEAHGLGSATQPE